MKYLGKYVEFFMLIFFAAAISGCVPYYSTIRQNPTQSTAGSNLAIYYVLPITFKSISIEPGSKAPTETWSIPEIQKEWLKEVAIQAKTRNVPGKVVPVDFGSDLSNFRDGVLVESRAVSYRDENTPMGGGYLFMKVELKFTEVATETVLFEGMVEVASKRLGPVVWMGVTQNGRVTLASWNVVPPIMSVIKTGRIEPKKD